MPFSHTLNYTLVAPGASISKSVTRTANNNNSFTEAIADAGTDVFVNATVDVSALQSVVITSDQQITLETNDGTTPQETIVLKANEPLVWMKSGNQLAGADYPAIPFSADVTAMYFTNASGSTANVRIEILQDPTP